ncbi:hypothetical protein EDD11_002143 [Mortierella claussenii]|nr:hypothetical protein EDD11_002143 [Mortierella claussenii]
MGYSSSDDWFTITLNEPYTVIPDLPSLSVSSSLPTTLSGSGAGPAQQDQLGGTIILSLTKPAKVKSLSLIFTGFARTVFHFDSSSIPGAKPCVALDKHSFGCTLTEQRHTLLASETKVPHLLPKGIHRFPFSVSISRHLPAVVTSRTINVNYQVTASLQLISILPFASPHTVTKPVILLQRDELPPDDLFNTTVVRISSKESARLSSNISIPCAVFPQAGTIPLMLNLSLKGNASTVTKITIELLESVYHYRSSRSDSDETEKKGVLIDERLVTRQNCPLQDWPSSTIEEPVLIPKRLLFKVPQTPLLIWSKSEELLTPSCSRSTLDKGFCHASGTYAHAGVRIAHSLRIAVHVRGLSSDTQGHIEHDYAESETSVWIVGNQEYKDDDTHPPSYYRSFSNTLVDGDKLHEIDQQAIEALQDELPFSVLLPFPPCYEGSLAGCSTASSSPTLTSIRYWPGSSRSSLERFSLDESDTMTDGSDNHNNDSYFSDLAAYTQRYSHAHPAPVLAM